MLAVITTGGKQYIVEPKQKLKVELLKTKEGDKVIFDKVLLIVDDKKTTVGTPYVNGARVEAKLVKHSRYPKVITFKYRPKAHHRRKKGHRQHFSEVEIVSVKV